MCLVMAVVSVRVQLKLDKGRCIKAKLCIILYVFTNDYCCNGPGCQDNMSSLLNNQ